MRKLAALLCLLLAWPAAAMDNTSTPPKFPIPWGNSAGASFIRSIPVASQIGINTGAASLTDGFPPVTFQSIAAGGIPPDGRDFNGILRQLSQALRWAQAGGMYVYDSSFSASIGGYPKGAVLQSKVLLGRIWYSTSDNNTTDPDGSATSSLWSVVPGANAAGTPIPWFSAGAAPPNSVLADGRQIGNASSGAPGRANADTYWLFIFLWTNCSACQLYNSSGTAIARGANFDADWNASDRIAVPPMQASGLIGADKSTALLSGVPVISGNTSTPTSLLGENLHTQSISEMPSHSHSVNVSDPGHFHTYTAVQNGGGPAGISTAGVAQIVSSQTNNTAVAQTNIAVSINNNGGGGAANTVQRSYLVYWYLAL